MLEPVAYVIEYRLMPETMCQHPFSFVKYSMLAGCHCKLCTCIHASYGLLKEYGEVPFNLFKDIETVVWLMQDGNNVAP